MGIRIRGMSGFTRAGSMQWGTINKHANNGTIQIPGLIIAGSPMTNNFQLFKAWLEYQATVGIWIANKFSYRIMGIWTLIEWFTNQMPGTKIIQNLGHQLVHRPGFRPPFAYRWYWASEKQLEKQQVKVCFSDCCYSDGFYNELLFHYSGHGLSNWSSNDRTVFNHSDA